MEDRIRYITNENLRVHKTCADVAKMETMQATVDEIAHLKEVFSAMTKLLTASRK